MASSFPCDRAQAREARGILQNYLIAKLTEIGPLSGSCPFHPSRDYLSSHEEYKRKVHPRQWRCALCQKSFRSERFLDKHLDRRHSDTLVKPQNAVCLSDFCELLRCPTWVDVAQRTNHMICNQNQLEERRQQCRSLIRRCTPISEELYQSDMKLSRIEELESSLCDPLSCEWRAMTQHAATLSGSLDVWSLVEGNDLGRNSSSFHVVSSLLVAAVLAFYWYLLRWHREEARVGQHTLRPKKNRANRSWLPTR